MPDDARAHGPAMAFETRLSQLGRPAKRAGKGTVNVPLIRASTVTFPDCATLRDARLRRLDQYGSYGIHGLATHHALEDVVAEIEGGDRAAIQGSGLAAIVVAMMAYLKAGDHCLMPDSCYGPTRNLCDTLLAGFGVETTYYDPCIDEAGIAKLIRDNTRVVYTESPGSHSFEVQDVPAISRAAHARGAKVLMDNTWGIHHFQPFRHGVDVSIQALTKYVVGHSDVLLGSVTVKNAEWPAIKNAQVTLGQYASADDVWLALRGSRTLPVRLARQAESAMTVARWLEGRPEVLRVLHPALESHPQHALWKRDFSGSCSLFGVVFQPRYTMDQVNRLIDGLDLFAIGASWGGYESLVLPTTGTLTRVATSADLGGPAMRLHIGQEDPRDLIADLGAGIAALDTPFTALED
ncbi:MAG: cystathionine beta-lyase [Acetobacteraceae bacterium]|nr:cystathionine beta-lyase [Acetobacteraceae bacterium]